MSDLWLPPQQQAGVRDFRQQVDAETMEQVDMELRNQVLHVHQLVQHLREFDPYLDVGFVGENVDHPQAQPNRWHLIRRNPDAPVTLTAITGPNGEYVEPGSGVYELVQRMDLQNNRVRSDMERRRLEEQREKERTQERKREEMREEVADRIKAKLNPGVSFTNQGRGWKQRAAARTQRKAA
jgi:hypothetical protein